MEKVGYKSPPVSARFKPGVSPNPGGKPANARNRLTAKFLLTLADDFEAHGKAAVEKCRTEEPGTYLRAIVALMPKELEIKRPLEELDDDALARIASAIQAAIFADGTAAGAEAHPTNPGTAAVN